MAVPPPKVIKKEDASKPESTGVVQGSEKKVDYSSDFAFRGSTGTSTGSGTQGSSASGQLSQVPKSPPNEIYVTDVGGNVSKGVVQVKPRQIVEASQGNYPFRNVTTQRPIIPVEVAPVKYSPKLQTQMEYMERIGKADFKTGYVRPEINQRVIQAVEQPNVVTFSPKLYERYKQLEVKGEVGRAVLQEQLDKSKQEVKYEPYGKAVTIDYGYLKIPVQKESVRQETKWEIFGGGAVEGIKGIVKATVVPVTKTLMGGGVKATPVYNDFGIRTGTRFELTKEGAATASLYLFQGKELINFGKKLIQVSTGKSIVDFQERPSKQTFANVVTNVGLIGLANLGKVSLFREGTAGSTGASQRPSDIIKGVRAGIKPVGAIAESAAKRMKVELPYVRLTKTEAKEQGLTATRFYYANPENKVLAQQAKSLYQIKSPTPSQEYQAGRIYGYRETEIQSYLMNKELKPIANIIWNNQYSQPTLNFKFVVPQGITRPIREFVSVNEKLFTSQAAKRGAAYSSSGKRLSPKSKAQRSQESKNQYYNPNIKYEVIRTKGVDYPQVTVKKGGASGKESKIIAKVTPEGKFLQLTSKAVSPAPYVKANIVKTLTFQEGKPTQISILEKNAPSKILGGKAYSRPPSQVKTNYGEVGLSEQQIKIFQTLAPQKAIGLTKYVKPQPQSGAKKVFYPEEPKTLELISTGKGEVPTYVYRGVQTTQRAGFRKGMFEKLQQKVQQSRQARESQVKSQLPVPVETNKVWNVQDIKRMQKEYDTYGLSGRRSNDFDLSSTGKQELGQNPFKELSKKIGKKKEDAASTYYQYYTEYAVAGRPQPLSLPFENIITLRAGTYKIGAIPQVEAKVTQTYQPLLALSPKALQENALAQQPVLSQIQRNELTQTQVLEQQPMLSQVNLNEQTLAQAQILSQAQAQSLVQVQQLQQRQMLDTTIVGRTRQTTEKITQKVSQPKLERPTPIQRIRQPNFFRGKLTPEPKIEPKVPKTPPYIPNLDKKPSKKKQDTLSKAKGYNVLVKRKLTKRGRRYIEAGFAQANKQPLTFESASGLGQTLTSQTARRSYKIVPVKEEGTPIAEYEKAFQTLKGRFRPSKRLEGVQIQQTRFSISSAGEKREIRKPKLTRRRNKNAFFK